MLCEELAEVLMPRGRHCRVDIVDDGPSASGSLLVGSALECSATSEGPCSVPNGVRVRVELLYEPRPEHFVPIGGLPEGAMHVGACVLPTGDGYKVGGRLAKDFAAK